MTMRFLVNFTNWQNLEKLENLVNFTGDPCLVSTLERKTSDLHAKGREWEWEWEGKVQAEEGKVKEKGKVDCPLETEIQATLAK